MDKIFQKYLARHTVWHPVHRSFEGAMLRVVVPVFLEEDYICIFLNSFAEAARSTRQPIELILVLNYAENASLEIKQRQEQLIAVIEAQPIDWSENTHLSIIKAFDLPSKHAGAGLARKIGMDYAASRFALEENVNGVIVSLDADCKISPDYFEQLYSIFASQQTKGCTIYFEHDTVGIDPGQKEAIEQYELHLRYYLQALRWTGHPYVYHTVGSCFAVTAEAYVRAGGMPRKQAGEDFYFLQKVIPLGQFKELNTTCVYPSARMSDRVPFGTGPTISKLITDQSEYQTYNLQAFIDLKACFDMKERFFKISAQEYQEVVYELSGRIRSYLMTSDFFGELNHINLNCSSIEAFNKRFFEVFDAFKVVKYLNYIHTHFLEKTAVFDAALDFLDLLEKDTMNLADTSDLLAYFRVLEKGT